jgi:hypothetical protein
VSVSRYLSAETQVQVRQRARYLCEYCHTSEQWQYIKFTIDHVIPLNRGGLNDLDNLALACFHCNRRKSNKITAIDEETQQEVLLFNPRYHNWKDHFIWSKNKLCIIGLTPTGRATINRLSFNRTRVIDIRSADVEVGRHPPSDDPIE